MDGQRSQQRWWLEPMMWLVLAGPAAVVVAGVITTVIAVRSPDPVLATDAAQTPAVQARNHAATAEAPAR